jgi:hypothetical protein
LATADASAARQRSKAFFEPQATGCELQAFSKESLRLEAYSLPRKKQLWNDAAILLTQNPTLR